MTQSIPKMTIADVYNELYSYQTSNVGLIKSAIKDVTALSYLEDYADSLDFEEFFNQNKRFVRPRCIVTNEAIQQEWLERNVQRILLAHSYTIKGLLESLEFEYNPIENYRMEETETTDNTNNTSGSDTLSINKNTTVTMDRGAQSVSNSENIGAQSGNSTSTEQIAPWNASYTDNKKVSDNYNANAYTNSSSSNRLSYKDSDSTTGKDTHTTDYGKNEKFDGNRTLTRAGNIGVTTSQQMIQAQRDLLQFDVIRQIVELINQNLCTGVYYIL